MTVYHYFLGFYRPQFGEFKLLMTHISYISPTSILLFITKTGEGGLLITINTLSLI